MLKTLESLEKSEIVKHYEILDFKQGKNFYFIKIKAIFVDKSELHIREFISEEEYLYSYHWQDNNGIMRIRWDNSLHHKHLKSFPHHDIPSKS
ncbi:MAG: DUF6516 family protein [Candidatus Thermoplasmatota archaeon]|nr:DUF6516 family protein [Candidatus Thermoplasmatota archaeon]